ATEFGAYPRRSTAFSTRTRVSGDTTSGRLRTRETVAVETPARLATSRMLDIDAQREGAIIMTQPAGRRICAHLVVSRGRHVVTPPRRTFNRLSVPKEAGTFAAKVPASFLSTSASGRKRRLAPFRGRCQPPFSDAICRGDGRWLKIPISRNECSARVHR